MCLKSPEAICTSTPRKSKSHYDRRCLFDQFMSLSGNSRLSLTVEKKSQQPPTLCLADVSAIHHVHASQSHLKMLEQQRVARKRRSSLLRLQIGRRLRQSPVGGSSETTPSTASTATRTPSKVQCLPEETPLEGGVGVLRQAVSTSTGTTTTSATATTTTTASSSDAFGRRSSSFGGDARRHRQRRHKRDRGPRLSLYASGGSYRTPNRVKLREQMRKKAHKQRRDNYNRGRDIDTEQRLQGGCLDIDSARESEDNNNSRTFRVNATIVLAKKSEYPEEYDIPEYTSNYFSELVAGTTTAIIEETSGECKTLSSTKSHEFTEVSEDYAYNSNDSQLTVDEKTTQNIIVDEKCAAETTIKSDETDTSNDSSSSSQSENISLPVEQSLKNEAADEPSTADDLEIFDARCKRFEQLAAETVSAAPFAVANVEFDVVATPENQAEFERLEKRREQQRHSITYTLMSQHELVASVKPQPTITSPVLFLKTLNDNHDNYNYDTEVKITLADVLNMWSSIWMRLDQQLQLTIFLAVFGPLIVLVYLTLSQYT